MVSTLQPELKVAFTRKVDKKWNVLLWGDPQYTRSRFAGKIGSKHPFITP